MADGTQPNDGESPVIVSLSDAAMHMYSSAIESLPDPGDQEFPGQAAVILAGLRKLESALSEAASRSGRAKLSPQEAANGIGLRADLIEAIEVEETPTDDEATRIK
jgi:hypothetical protein